MFNLKFEQVIGSLIAIILAILPAILLKINQLHILVNSRLTELLEVTKNAYKAQGIIEGRDTVRAEIAAEHASLSKEGELPCTVPILPIPPESGN